MKQKTRAEILVINTKLAEELRTVLDSDMSLRQEFTNALEGVYRCDERYGTGGSRKTYSWYEIFRELGKAIQQSKEANREDRIRELESMNQRLHEELNAQNPTHL